MAPAKIMVIRHAEKPDGRAEGVRASGKADAEALTARGWQRAGALVRFLAPGAGRAAAHPALAVPTAIVATRAEQGAGASRRPKETVRPLADLLGLEIDDRFGRDEEPAMVASVMARDGVVLVSWVHEGIPDLVAALPGAPAAPRAWPEDRFDLVWVLDPAGEGWRLTQVPQELLAGDRRDAIPI